MSGGGGGDGPGAPLWIISFADMISNMVIFFILVATFASRNTETNSVPKRVLDRQIGIFGTPKDLPRASLVPRIGTPATDGQVAAENPSKRHGTEAEDLQSRIQDKSYKVSPKITKLRDGVRIGLEGAGAFEAGSDELSPDGREILAEVGRFYQAEPVDFVVEAYTDDRSFRFSQHASDVDLARAMAMSVARVLARDAGIEPQRVGISPFGSEQPLESNATAAGRAKNRRVEIVIRERP